MATTTVSIAPDAEILRSVVSLVSNVTQDKGFLAACQDLDRAGDADAVLMKTLRQSAKIIAVEASALRSGLPVEVGAALARGGVECCFSIMCGRLVEYLARAEVEGAAAVRECIAMLTEGDARSALRLKVAVNLYNSLPASSLRCEVLRSVVSFAVSSGQFALVRGYLVGIDAVIATWGLPIEETRTLYSLVVKVLAAAPGNAAQAQRFNLLLIDSYDGAAAFAALDDAAPSSVALRESIAAAITAAIRSPIEALRASVDLLAHPAVAYLKAQSAAGSAEAVLVGLLETVMVDGEGSDLAKFDAFLAAGSNSATMATLGIDTEQCREKIRLLSLCSLASQRDEIAYADAAAVLQVAAGDVEQWVVDAMTQQLIDARLDQQRQVIIVHASTQRTRSAAQFAAANGESQEEWVALKTRLDAWKSEMGAVLETMSKIQDSR